MEKPGLDLVGPAPLEGLAVVVAGLVAVVRDACIPEAITLAGLVVAGGAPSIARGNGIATGGVPTIPDVGGVLVVVVVGVVVVVVGFTGVVDSASDGDDAVEPFVDGGVLAVAGVVDCAGLLGVGTEAFPICLGRM
jgi:hypothetical protein